MDNSQGIFYESSVESRIAEAKMTNTKDHRFLRKLPTLKISWKFKVAMICNKISMVFSFKTYEPISSFWTDNYIVSIFCL